VYFNDKMIVSLNDTSHMALHYEGLINGSLGLEVGLIKFRIRPDNPIYPNHYRAVWFKIIVNVLGYRN